MKSFVAEFVRFLTVVIVCAVFGIGIGFVQGEIVARRADKIEQVVFAGGAAMIGGLVACVLGPLLYYLNRQITFEQFCYVLTSASVAGGTAAWLLSIPANGPGWWSMFVTPAVAIFATVYFRTVFDSSARADVPR